MTQERKLEEYHFVREIEILDHVIKVIQDTRSSEHGAYVWDGSLVFAHYFENQTIFPQGHFANKKILELGSGMIGIILAKLGAQCVYITDKQAVVPLIQWNVDTNCTEQEKQNIVVQELLWGQPLSDVIAKEIFDYIVFSDCVYSNKQIWMLLAQTIDDLTTDMTEVLFSYELRSKVDLEFFSWMKQQYGFEYVKVSEKELHEDWCAPEIGVFHMWSAKKQAEKMAASKK